MNWDEESLECGYVLDRVAGGRWWHLHFGRLAWSYHCDLLGVRTQVLACVQRFSTGAVAESPKFFLTLDNEGVVLPAEVNLDFGWGDRSRDLALASEALRFQREVMPLLNASQVFRRAVGEVVARQQHLQVIPWNKLSGS